MNYTTYLFDFDYTLADSSTGIVICFRNVLNRHGFTEVNDEAIKRTIGKTLEESFGILTGNNDNQQLISFRKEYEKEANVYMTANTFLFPETIDVLHKLKKKGVKLGIISTKYRYRIQELLSSHFEQGFFDIIIGGEDVKTHKPSPEGLLKAIQILNVDKVNVMYVGDSIVDAETAQSADVSFTGILHGTTTRKELEAYPHRLIVNDLTELLASKNKLTISMRFRCWFRWIRMKQITGFQTRKLDKESGVCKNCDQTFMGNYCNRCGQDKKTSRLRWQTMLQNAIGGISSIDRGFALTLLELIFRPGYMIKDYIAGKRIRYFRPFQMLFLLSATYLLWAQFVDPTIDDKKVIKNNRIENTEVLKKDLEDILDYKIIKKTTSAQTADSITKKISESKHIKSDIDETADKKPSGFVDKTIGFIKKWTDKNKAISILFTFPIFAIATRFAFYRRKKLNYNLTEEVFIQAYIACQILLISIVCLAFSSRVAVDDLYDIPEWAIFALFVWDYKQLFQYKWWQTILKTMLMFVYSIIVIILIAIIVVLLFMLISYITKSANLIY